jgi:hypothetical protein
VFVASANVNDGLLFSDQPSLGGSCSGGRVPQKYGSSNQRCHIVSNKAHQAKPLVTVHLLLSPRYLRVAVNRQNDKEETKTTRATALPMRSVETVKKHGELAVGASLHRRIRVQWLTIWIS